ncbi:MAG: ATP-binding cassette domain-containing protein [Fimbriimonadaceae bacterium]|nr:ATP-binding cassette domain-containing protein [Fimbriimonadaceae bacterium]
MSETLLSIRGLSKAFGGVRALDDVSLDVSAGEVHAVCGENGAGKSTLNRILAGVLAPDAGELLFGDRWLTTGSVPATEAAGIAMVHQESAAFPHLGASDNVSLMREPTRLGGWWLDRREMKRRTVEALRSLGESFDPERPLEERSPAQRQMVAIARAVSRDCRLLILDEPTASLSARETDALFAVVRAMRNRGVSVLYVTHRLDEVFTLADRVTVLRDGRLVETLRTGATDREGLIRRMVGRELGVAEDGGTRLAPSEPLLKVRGLSRTGAFDEVSLEVSRGEVVVLAGLVGAGRSEVARAILGLDAYDAGEITIDGVAVPADAPGAVRQGLGLVPEDRQHEGLHLPMTVRDNLAMVERPARLGVRDRRAEAALSSDTIGALSIKCASDLAEVASLSGGNQQKVLLGKWLATDPRVLLLDEPTRGVDVGAKEQIHRLIGDLAKRGVAILVVSSDLPEVLRLADRVVVMRQGRVAGELARGEASQERILELALPRETDPAVSAPPRRRLRRELSVGSLLALTLVAAAVVNPGFVGLDNLRDMAVKVAPALIVGSMMTLVVLAREIDISVGSLMGLCAAGLGIACSEDRLALPVYAGVAVCLGIGLVGGLLNGVLVSYGRVPSIIVTLGTLTVYRGATERLMAGRWIENLPDGLRAFGTGAFVGVPYGVLTAGTVVLIAAWLSLRTPFGRRVVALGSDPRSAELVGVPVHRVQMAVFALTGLGSGVAALFAATQLQVIESGFGNGFELVVVASVIVGGTSIRGGRGTVLGTVLGATLLGIVATVLIFLRLGESATYWERAIQGGLILLAVLGDHLSRRGRGVSA